MLAFFFSLVCVSAASLRLVLVLPLSLVSPSYSQLQSRTELLIDNLCLYDKPQCGTSILDILTYLHSITSG